MAGRTIVITGASDGIGAAVAARLCESGENVVVVGRSEHKTKAVAEQLGTDCFIADFADLSQVRALAKHLLEQYPRIDVLANNAGGMTSKREMTTDGHEKTLQVNYLAPVLLTALLLDRLVESRAAVLNTSSASQKLLGTVNVDDIFDTHRFRPSKSYALTKLAVILFTKELHRRYHDAGLATAAFHPGYIRSNFGHASGSRLLQFMWHTPVRYVTPSAERGSDHLVWLASGTPGVDWQSGEYYARLRPAKGNRQANDPVLARDVWDRSLAMIGG